MKTTLQILVDGRALIAEPSGWTQGVLARDCAGRVADWNAPNAVCFCSLGALDRADQAGTAVSPHVVASEILCRAMDGDVVEFNDTRSHDEVLAAWDCAIATAQGAAA